MKFSVIYSIDVAQGTRLQQFMPPSLRRYWSQTEGDASYELAYIGGRWKRGKHRKYCALLPNEAAFKEFVDYCGLYADDVETMGSLGAPGFGWGLAPAISFTGDVDGAFLSAYVTPIPGTKPPKTKAAMARAWKRLRAGIIARYS
jgi:hypothetical protein